MKLSLLLLTLTPAVFAISEDAAREPILGINPYDTSYSEVALAIDSQGWLIAATLLEEPAAFRHCEFGDEQITVYLSDYEAGRVLHLSYALKAKDDSDEALARLEIEYRRLFLGFEALRKSGTGPVFGCYWTPGAHDGYVEYHPPGEDGPRLSVGGSFSIDRRRRPPDERTTLGVSPLTRSVCSICSRREKGARRDDSIVEQLHPVHPTSNHNNVKVEPCASVG